MIRKCIQITETNNEVLKNLKKELSFSSESQVINYLIQNSAKSLEERIAKAVIQEMNDSYLYKERLKWSLQTAEQNSIILLDAVNTLLHNENLNTCITTDFLPNEVITQSKNNLKEKITHFKQKSDDRKAKQEQGGQN